MLSYFTELNRKPVPADLLDFVSHCTCPIVHAADDLSVGLGHGPVHHFHNIWDR